MKNKKTDGLKKLMKFIKLENIVKFCIRVEK